MLANAGSEARTYPGGRPSASPARPAEITHLLAPPASGEVDPAPRRVSLFGSEEVRRASRWGASRVEGQRRIDAHCINEDGLPSFFIGAPCG